MPILNLADLQPGDVVLDPGMPQIATGTGTGNFQFGHARLALNRLLFIHAPKIGRMAQVSPFEVNVWRRPDGTNLLGAVCKEGTAVYRWGGAPQSSELIARMMHEIGYGYADVDKLKQIGDLSADLRANLDEPSTRDLLRRLAKGKVPLDADGRSCGELVARILFADDNPSVSPNALAADARLSEVPGVIVSPAELQHLGSHEVNEAITKIMAGFHPEPARKLWRDLVAAAKDKPGPAERAEIASRFEEHVVIELTENSARLHEVANAEAQLF